MSTPGAEDPSDSPAAARRFPRDPLSGQRDPFQNEEGRNPFSDPLPANAAVAAAAAGSFASPEAAGQHDYRPGEYVSMLPHRSGRVLLAGVIAMALNLLALAAVASFAGHAERAMVMTLPLQLFGLAVAFAGWFMGSGDLRAMRAGAMDAAGRRQTQWGRNLCRAAAALAAGPIIALLALLGQAAWQ